MGYDTKVCSILTHIVIFKMKLFNPFKPHLVKFGEGFAVRKFSIFYMSWTYVDTTTGFWWTTGSMHVIDTVTTEEKARLALKVLTDNGTYVP